MKNRPSDIPSPTENYSQFYRRAPINIKKELEKTKEKKKIFLLSSKKEEVISEIETDKNHHELMKLCVKSFAQTKLSELSGYEFYFAEPLIEFGSDGDGNQSFDLFLYNEEENRSIFIECKSSISKGNKLLREIDKSKNLVLKKIDYLSELIGIELDTERIEYVAAIYDKDKDKVIESLKEKEKTGEINETKLWVYKPNSGVVQLYHNHSHDNDILTELLLSGFGNDEAKSRYDLPCCYSSHLFRQIIINIISECYNDNIRKEGLKDPKLIPIKDIRTVMCKNISLGVSEEKKKELIEKRLEKMLRYGEKYDLFEIKDENIRLKCQGEKLKVVLKNLEDKHIKNWVESKAEIESGKLAIEEYKRSIADKGIQKSIFSKF